jgi:hypothetical protein
MRRPRVLIPLAVALAMGLAPAASHASAISCGRWSRLGAGQKEATVHSMIDDALASGRGRQYDVNREAIGRCLRGNVSQIAIAFDDACSDPRSAEMQAIPNLFKSYVWSCAD